MTENSNVYGGHETGSSAAEFNWKQPSQLFSLLLQFVKNPLEAARQIVYSEVIALPFVLVAINIITIFVASIICIIATKIKYGFYLSLIHIPLAVIVMMTVFVSAIFDFGLAGLLFISTNLIFKHKIGFLKILSMVGSKVVIDSIFMLVGSIFVFISSFFFYIFIITGNIISFAVLITVYNEEELSPLKKLYSFSFSTVVVSIMLFSLLKILSSFLAVLSYMW